MIKQTYRINATIDEVWDALTNPETMEDWGAGPAEMDDSEDGEFSLWGGDIWGKNIEVEANKKLVQEWYGGDWEEPSYVTFALIEEGDLTIVELTHENVPEDEEEEFEDGWSDYYLGAIKEYLEE
ncbi:MAG: SRPBCC domain-containing protein [Candidatus Dojkabacteria bacterium]|nr:SRPBCC domain-containing protein [Candidatus Dojkabacteria bacterium]MDQ7020308.1 SRPBCC domain-containing protein [Candidatus Dojkabacteria bacterium]